MERINFHGRRVAQITSEEGQRDYYNHLVYCNNCGQDAILRRTPTKEEATEYLKLKKKNHLCSAVALSVRNFISYRSMKILMTGEP